MSLAKCRSCEKEVSTTARQCPHCGRPSPSTSPWTMIIIYILTVVIMGFVFLMLL
ncbi:zinc-ribbon domain-containing protein [Halomonas salipaludis]|uniref:zinc-ribbon domain-containing protein n=1 Tax=Halomonas salipaludis TaxID=2032625 RepID=UPI0038994289